VNEHRLHGANADCGAAIDAILELVGKAPMAFFRLDCKTHPFEK
jgi:hypothetical protein